jgi:hypothetical protein
MLRMGHSVRFKDKVCNAETLRSRRKITNPEE